MSAGKNILVYDVAASESGALSVLLDFYKQALSYPDKSVRWIFALSTPEIAEAENVRVLRFPWVKKSPLHRLFFDWFAARSLVRRYGLDAVVSLQNTTVFGCKKPQVVSLHNTLPLYAADATVLAGRAAICKQRLVNKRILRSLRRASAVIVPAEWIKRAYAQKLGIAADKFYVAPMRIDRRGLCECALGEAVDSFFYPATAQPYKRHAMILDACAALAAQGRDPRVLLTITGEENAYAVGLKKRARELGERVEFGGVIPREAVFARYAHSALVFPSVIETDALPLVEARLSGTFILAADTPFSREILKEYPNCAFFEDGDAAALAARMAALMDGGRGLLPDPLARERAYIDRAALCVDILEKRGWAR